MRPLLVSSFVLAAGLVGCATHPPVVPSVGASATAPAAVDAAVPSLPLDPEPTGRLPAGVTPLRYALSLELVPSRERFRGEVDIRVRLDAAHSGLWMHGQDLSVTAAEIRPANGPPVPARWVPGTREGIASVRWDGIVAPGEATVHLVFDAPFNRHLEGLYRVDNQGDSYAFTQFEAISARKAFPCFDEPRFKTPFDIRLTVLAEHRAITNTLEVESAAADGGLRTLRFAPTEPLPTYLLAFAVGPLEVVDAPAIAPNDLRTTPLPFRGVAPRGRGRFLERSLRDTPAMLVAMERYFHRAYPYPKLDLIAVPDFAAGAMENAGAITFRENLLLLRPDAPVDQPRGVDGVIAHELAHHWFGNLVTLQWWDDIWLNESFATWMGTRVTDEVFPEHHTAIGMLAAVHGAMGADALASSVPIHRPIETDDDLRGGSSAIVYQKGAAVLNMFERAMGPERFRDGIRAYLAAHAHGVATSADLYRALSDAAHEPTLEASFRSFVEQSGVPLLSMDLVCDANGRRITTVARRFVLPAAAARPDTQWTVPVCVRVPDGNALREVCGTVHAEHPSLDLGPGACPGWFVPNADGRGYFRWTLPAARWSTLATPPVWSRLSALERLSVVNNARAAFTAGTLDYPALRPLLTLAAHDAERVVAIDPLAFWVRVTSDELSGPSAAAARRFAASLYTPTWSSLTWSARPNDDAERVLLRRDLAGFLGLFGEVPSVRAEGARLARQWLAAPTATPSVLPPELVGPAIGMLLRSGDADALARVREMALTSDDAVVRFRLLGALAQAPEGPLTHDVLSIAMDPRVRVNEVFTTLNAALDRGDVREATFAWLSAHLDELYTRISRNGRSGTPWLAARLCGADDPARVRALFEPRLRDLPGSETQLRGALEAISVCSAEREAQGASLRAAFGSR